MYGYEEFKNACINAMLFTDTGGDSEIPEGVELSVDLKKRIEADCYSFLSRCWYYIRETDKSFRHAGVDFWLTRNGHGSGFWDGDWDDTPYAAMLAEIATGYGPIETFLDDNGHIDA